MKSIKIIFAFIILLMSGCAQNNFKTFYTQQDDIANKNIKLCTGEPDFFVVQDFSKDIMIKHAQEGYWMIGSSVFVRSGFENKDSIMSFAKSIGACRVLAFEKVKGTHQNYMPVFTPFGTTYAPNAVDRVEYSVAYLAKFKGKIGTFVDDIPDDVREKYSTNLGAYICGVEKNSKAFFAEIIKGDIIIFVNNNKVNTAKDYLDMVLNKDFSEITLTIFRNGKNIEKKLYWDSNEMQ